ncbi:hypothetical protein Q5P01_009513 [Channa striata]|uniref:Aquaporin n=1 Tax=Channa striata TaxID=64152 RepID=A0AA88MW72_CHASR|nr:hypothetical protein Q5P01_009513 [Channa striata]
MAADLAASLAVLLGVVALSEAARRFLSRALARAGLSADAVELVSTFQLCCCTHELKLLSDVGGLEPRLALTLTYLASVVHGLTFDGAIGNPTGALERACRGRMSRWCALRRTACQFAAAAAARAAVPTVWSFGWSGLHARHKRLGFRCISSIHAPLPEAAAVELACAFAVQTVVTRTRSVPERYRVHAVAAAIATCVYAGGSWTGAVCNPAVAFSTQFPCTGNSFLEYCLVYWLGPLLGVMTSVLVFDKLVSLPSRKSSVLRQRQEMKKRT